MKYSFSLISKLYSISILWFGGSLLIILYVLLNLIFPNKDFMIKKDNYAIGNRNIFKNGYSIPATISIHMPPDTLIKFSKGPSSGGLNLSNGDIFRSASADSILNDESINKEFYFYRWILQPAEFESINSNNFQASNELELFNNQVKQYSKNLNVSIEKSYSFETTIKIKAKSFYKNLILSFYSLIYLIFSLVISFQFMKIVQELYKKISFEKSIYRRLNIIGLTIIVVQFLKLALSIIFSRWYGSVTLLNSSVLSSGNNNVFQVQFNPTLDLSFSAILLGLSIIVLSYIFKYGNKIEQENALTV